MDNFRNPHVYCDLAFIAKIIVRRCERVLRKETFTHIQECLASDCHGWYRAIVHRIVASSVNNYRPAKCLKCGGNGFRLEVWQDGGQWNASACVPVTCEACNGQGFV